MTLDFLHPEAIANLSFRVWQVHGFEETHATFLQTDLLKLLVKKCSKGTGFSKTWLLRDLEVRDEGTPATASCCRFTGLGVRAARQSQLVLPCALASGAVVKTVSYICLPFWK